MSLGHDESKTIEAKRRRERCPRGLAARRYCRAGRWKTLAANQDGSGAVEMALVLPFAMLLLLGVVQFGGLFFLQNQMTHVANDVVRRVAVGDLAESAAAAEVATRLASWSATFGVVVDEPTAGDIRVALTVPLADAVLIDLGNWTSSGSLRAQAIMRRE